MAGACDSGGACEREVDCNDGNWCTFDFCVANMCSIMPATNGPVGQGQVEGDCQTLACMDGELGSVVDDNDVPDDSNPCTMDACSAGTPAHDPAPDGTACGPNGAVCVAGQCQ